MKESHSGAVQGVLIAAMAIWGLNISAVKVLAQQIDPVLLAALRMLVASVSLTFIVFSKRTALPKVTPRQLAAFVVCAALMVYANQILFAEGMRRSTATNASLIMAISPLVSAVLAAIAFGERLSRRRGLGVLLGLAGVTAVVFSHPGAALAHAGLGDLMVSGSVVSFAMGGAIVQRLAPKFQTLTLSWAIYVMGSVLLVAHALAEQGSAIWAALLPGWGAWGLILFSGVMASALANLAWNGAIARIGVARTAVFLYWVPVFGVIFAALLLGERLTAWHFAGFAAVMAGTWLGAQRSAVPTPTSALAQARAREHTDP